MPFEGLLDIYSRFAVNEGLYSHTFDSTQVIIYEVPDFPNVKPLYSQAIEIPLFFYNNGNDYIDMFDIKLSIAHEGLSEPTDLIISCIGLFNDNVDEFIKNLSDLEDALQSILGNKPAYYVIPTITTESISKELSTVYICKASGKDYIRFIN